MKPNDPPPPPAAEQESVPPDLPLPYIQAARSLAACERPFNENVTADGMLAELEYTFMADGDCETLLFTQTRVLDSMFHRALSKALEGKGNANCLDDDRFKLAMRSQKLSRQAAEALARVKAFHAVKNGRTK